MIKMSFHTAVLHLYHNVTRKKVNTIDQSYKNIAELHICEELSCLWKQIISIWSIFSKMTRSQRISKGLDIFGQETGVIMSYYDQF